MAEVNTINPLQLNACTEKRECIKSGRPRKNKEIVFTIPPRSFISLLLSKETEMKNDNNKKKTSIKVTKNYSACKKELYKEHMGLHKYLLHNCNYPNCTYSTKSSSNLIKHKRIHTSEKAYICDQCLFRTNFQNSLTVHMRIHTSERPYGCQYCQYKCNSSSNLKKHIINKH